MGRQNGSVVRHALRASHHEESAHSCATRDDTSPRFYRASLARRRESGFPSRAASVALDDSGDARSRRASGTLETTRSRAHARVFAVLRSSVSPNSRTGLALGGAAPVLAPQAGAQPTAHTACKSATIHGKHKCIAAGQYCTRAYEKDYEKYGYTCSKRDKNGRYHLQRLGRG
jgi:hypothetical protein